MVDAILGIHGSLSTTRMRALCLAVELTDPLDDSTEPPRPPSVQPDGQAAAASVLVDLPVPPPVAALALLGLRSGRLLLLGTFSPGSVAGATRWGSSSLLKAGIE